MSAIWISKEIEFCAAHRLPLSYEGLCRSLHGHNYKIEVILDGDTLDGNGLLVDFGVVKKIVKDWIDTNVDHAYISADGARVYSAMATAQDYGFLRVYQMPEGMTSSAECLAMHFMDVFKRLLLLNGTLAKLQAVIVWETSTSKAACRNDV